MSIVRATSFSSRVWRAVAVVIALAALSTVGQAQWGPWEYGCFRCIEDNPGAPWPDRECAQVGNNSHGSGILCREGRVGSFGKVCVTSGGSCFNVDSGGGGGLGGDPLDQNPDGCTIDPGTVCPASCSSCTIG